MKRPLLPLLILLALLSLGLTHNQSRGTHPGHVHARLSPEAALAQAVARSIPERNLYRLTQELRLHPPRPFPHVVRTTSPNFPVGHSDSFNVLGEDKNRYFVMHATIRAKTPHFYLYVQDGVTFSQTSLLKAADVFEHSTYPTDRSFFGSEWRPGVDGDPHVTCLIGNLKSSGVGGYFSAEDEYPKIVNPFSNQREMFYIDAKGATPGEGYFNLTLAHEFQHMIHWHVHPHENLWLNEGMSMLAEKLNGYSVNGEPSAFVTTPTTQLNTWNQSASASVAHYGAAYLFLAYLYDRFGRGVIHDILANKKFTDFQLINDVLQRRHIHASAEQLFAQWVVANYLNDRSVSGGIYSYKQLPEPVDTQKTTSVPFRYQATIPPYAANYVVGNINPGQAPFRLKFAGTARVPLIGAGHQAPFWWSNRGDMTDTHMERLLDLTHVSHATLLFKTWYDIEKDYDYGYVEVSRDGGKTWETVRGTHTTRFNPNGASYGDAYTGSSKRWTNESADLSRFAHHKVLLRFEYVTDEGYNGQSWALKNLRIPEIHFRDNFTGWRQEGFLPVAKNALPDKWTVQVVARTSKGVTVARMPLSGEQGSLVYDPAKLGLKKLVVIVYNAAPKTTLKSSFQLSTQAAQ